MSNETIALSTIEAARELRVHPNTLLRWVAQGKVPFVRLGGRKLLFSRSEISKLVAGQLIQTTSTRHEKVNQD